MKYRFAWDAPLVRSPHGSDTLYYAANVVFQSSDLGRSWEAISRDLSHADVSRMRPSGGPVFTDNSSSETYGTITRLAESPVRRGVLWAGTDDGNVQVTVNGGGAWTNVATNLPAAVSGSPVSCVEPSHAEAETVYVALDRHMLDDLAPYVFKSADSGKTWKRITAGLPAQAVVWVVREDPRNPRLLYAGTELGLFASFDAGDSWNSLDLRNLPHVAVRDIVIQPAQNDILLATHGRGIWVLDDATPLQQLAAAQGRAAWLFPMRTAWRYSMRATRSGGGDKEFAAANAPYGAILNYSLQTAAPEVRFEVLDGSGKTVRSLGGPQIARGAGVHRVVWDLRAASPDGSASPRRGVARGPQVLPGRYTIRMTAGQEVVEQPVEVALDPDLHVAPADLELQWKSLNRIAGMIRGAGQMIREVERHPGAPEWREFRAGLARLPRQSRSEAGPGLMEQLQLLFTIIDEPNAAPTHAALDLLQQLETEFAQAEAQFAKLPR